jgi:hypothetical protein
MLQRQVFDDAIKIAMSLVVCFLQSQFHHQWRFHQENQARKSEKLCRCVKPLHSCCIAPNSSHFHQKLLLKEPFNPISTWSSKPMVANNGEVCCTTGYL